VQTARAGKTLTPRPPDELARLLVEVRACTLCAAQLAHGPRPVLQAGSTARILIAGQAPGRKVHQSGIPFDDASGDRLRQWMGIGKQAFHDPKLVAILPMGFCYPGSASSGDLPPRPECAPAWRAQLLQHLPDLQLTLLIGQYAQAWHLRPPSRVSLTQTVRAWPQHGPQVLPLPHPSPRNQGWFKRNPWFEEEVLPVLRARVKLLLETNKK
jgi:uracil-DNA glycosylase